MAEKRTRPLPEVQNDEPTVTLSCQDWSLSQAVRWIADQTGVSVVVQESIDSKPVTVDVVEQPVSLVLQTIAKRAGVAANSSAGVFYLGTLSREDRGVLVRRAPKLSKDDLRQTLDSFTSEKGTVNTYDDGVVVVGDRVDVLERVNDLLDQLQEMKAKTYAVQLHIVSLNERAIRDFGFDVVPSGRIAAGFNATPAGSTASAEVDASVAAVLRAAGESSDVQLVAEPVVVCVDGQAATMRLLERRPFTNQRTEFSDGVQSQSTETEFLEVGIDIEVSVRDGGDGSVVLKSVVSLTEETGSIDGVPVVAEQSIDSRANVRADVVSLLGSMARSRAGDVSPALFSWGNLQTSSVELVQVWCRVYEVE